MNNDIGVLFLMGPPECNDPRIPGYSQEFLDELSKRMGRTVKTVSEAEFQEQALHIFFIASGGAETGFLNAHIAVEGPYILLTTPYYNSFAAAMEIMGYLEDNGKKGEILHGDIETIAHRIDVLEHIVNAKVALKGARLGCIGKPGGLIASEANPVLLREKTGMEIVDIDLQELIAEYQQGEYEDNRYTLELKAKGFNSEETEHALWVYGALKRMITRYDLKGVTVRCFDLLKAVKTTGCLALAILNSEGIPAACEGDSRTLVSMMLLRALTGDVSFMANPSSMNPKDSEIVFAHCTLPITMPDSYNLVTHFESGIGVALAADIAPQPVTLFKCKDDLSIYYAGEADLLETTHRDDLCRTQMRLKLKDGTDYFAKRPISNHHLICKGHWKEVIEEFFLSV